MIFQWIGAQRTSRLNNGSRINFNSDILALIWQFVSSLWWADVQHQVFHSTSRAFATVTIRCYWLKSSCFLIRIALVWMCVRLEVLNCSKSSRFSHQSICNLICWNRHPLRCFLLLSSLVIVCIHKLFSFLQSFRFGCSFFDFSLLERLLKHFLRLNVPICILWIIIQEGVGSYLICTSTLVAALVHIV